MAEEIKKKAAPKKEAKEAKPEGAAAVTDAAAPAKPAKKAAGARKGSKTSMILEMLKRAGGATPQELLKATGWVWFARFTTPALVIVATEFIGALGLIRNGRIEP